MRNNLEYFEWMNGKGEAVVFLKKIAIGKHQIYVQQVFNLDFFIEPTISCLKFIFVMRLTNFSIHWWILISQKQSRIWFVQNKFLKPKCMYFIRVKTVCLEKNFYYCPFYLSGAKNSTLFFFMPKVLLNQWQLALTLSILRIFSISTNFDFLFRLINICKEFIWSINGWLDFKSKPFLTSTFIYI